MTKESKEQYEQIVSKHYEGKEEGNDLEQKPDDKNLDAGLIFSLADLFRVLDAEKFYGKNKLLTIDRHGRTLIQ